MSQLRGPVGFENPLTLDCNGSSNAYQRWRGGMGARTGLDEKVSKARIAASPSNVYYRSLKDDILSGRLRPGLKLTTAFLYGRYKAGIGTMREALAALQTEGLVEANPGRGLWVTTMSGAALRVVSAPYTQCAHRRGVG